MKKEVQKWTFSVEDVTMEEAVSEFFDGDWDPIDWKETETNIDSYIEEFSEISDKEENRLRSEIKKEYDEKVSKLKKEETDQLKNRESILEWIGNSCDDWPDEGVVGYMLSREEILDLILQNGNK
jgi:hypothetical protein